MPNDLGLSRREREHDFEFAATEARETVGCWPVLGGLTSVAARLERPKAEKNPKLVSADPLLSNLSILQPENGYGVPSNGLVLHVINANPRAKLPSSHRSMRNSHDDSIAGFKDVVHLGLKFRVGCDVSLNNTANAT